MASKRNKRRKSCGKKVRHLSKDDAMMHMREIRRTRGYKYEVYPCKFCHGWHVGRPDKKKVQMIAAIKQSRVFK